MMVAAIGTTLLAITSTSIGHLLKRSRGDAALAGVLSQLRQARDLAINRRRTIQVDSSPRTRCVLPSSTSRTARR
jgi:Tfp pilus assembly protein FimT